MGRDLPALKAHFTIYQNLKLGSTSIAQANFARSDLLNICNSSDKQVIAQHSDNWDYGLLDDDDDDFDRKRQKN